MNEKEIISKLRLLQSVQPDEKILKLIRKRISYQIFSGKDFSSRKWLTNTPFIPVFTVVTIIFVLLIIGIFSNIFDSTLLTIKIAIAPNHYEMAKIALANVHDKIVKLSENESDINKVTQISNSLSLANTEMSGLKLIGEKGKYTAYQCEELYEVYHRDLGKIENSFRNDKTNFSKNLLSEVEQYDKEAQGKLKNYNQKKWIKSKI